MLKPDLSTQRNDLLAQTLHHLDQLEGADVRVRLVQDFGRRAMLHKFLHHLAAQKARVLDLAVELAVGKRAGAAFAELHVALRVERFLAPQAPGVLSALPHRLAALQHDGPEPHLRQHQRRKHAAWPETHHHRALLQARRRLRHHAVGHIGCGADVRVRGVPGQQVGLQRGVCQCDVCDVDRQQVSLAGIEAALENLQAGDCSGVHAQRLGTQAGESVYRVGYRCAVGLGLRRCVCSPAHLDGQRREREFEFGDADHGARGYQARPRF